MAALLTVMAMIETGCSSKSSRAAAHLRWVEAIQPEQLSDHTSLSYTGKLD